MSFSKPDGVYCASCDCAIECDCNELGARVPCPSCGETKRVVHVSAIESMRVVDGVGMKFKRDGVKKPVLEQFDMPSYSRSRNEYVRRVSVIDREDDRYFEKVSVYGTGEVLHHCEEPLSEHVGHGSAKVPTETIADIPINMNKSIEGNQ